MILTNKAVSIMSSLYSKYFFSNYEFQFRKKYLFVLDQSSSLSLSTLKETCSLIIGSVGNSMNVFI